MSLRELRQMKGMARAAAVALFTFAHFLIVTFSSAQGTVRYFINPADRIEEKLDGKLQSRVATRQLDPGAHRFTFYAKGFQLLDTVVNIEQDAILDLRYVLKVDPDHQRFRDAEKVRQNGRVLWVYTPAAFTVGGLAWTLNAMKKESEAYDALKASEASYSTLNSPSQVQALKDEVIPSQEQALEDAQRAVLTASVFTGTMAAVTIYGLIRSSHRKVPAFEDRQKLRFDGIAWVPNGSSGIMLAGLTVLLR
jgi:hypothetical protein